MGGERKWKKWRYDEERERNDERDRKNGYKDVHMVGRESESNQNEINIMVDKSKAINLS